MICCYISLFNTQRRKTVDSDRGKAGERAKIDIYNRIAAATATTTTYSKRFIHYL